MDMAENKNWFLWRGLASLVLIGLLVVGGLATHYAGWSQGYAAGQLAAGGGEVVTPPYLPHAGWPVGFALYAPGAGLLLMLKVVLLLLFLAVTGKLMRFVIWGPAWRLGMAGPHFRRGADWRRAARWHRMHGPVPPWCWGWEEPREEQPGEVEPEADTGNAGA